MIKKDDIFLATEGGKSVIVHYYPQASACFTGRGKNFKIREDDRNPSCTVFEKEGVWFIQDKGGSDTKAYTAIQLVQREEHLTFAQAIEWIAAKFAPHLLGEKTVSTRPQPKMEEVKAQNMISVQHRQSGEFTQAELDMLGYKITPELCKDLHLEPLASYITAKNQKGKSYKISATETYPIYYYNYGTWGKIYQPLGDIRFLYVGQKPENFVFGDNAFMLAYERAKNGIYPGSPDEKPKGGDDEEEGIEVPAKFKHLIICSGPSDALNVRGANMDYHVCWLNSETADLSEFEHANMEHIAEKLYILYDIDETGLANMYRIALRYLDLRIIQLPAELKRFNDRKGKPCKDAKDFFVHFRRPENPNPRSLFADLVKLSGSLMFWTRKETRTGWQYDVNNEQMYSFLSAAGFHKIATPAEKKGYSYCFVQDNVVTLIDESAIGSMCASHLMEYLKTHPKYWSQQLANCLYRSAQMEAKSLSHLQTVQPDFKSWDSKRDILFFRNGIFGVTEKGISRLKPEDCPCMVYSNKILPYDFTIEEPFFDIDYSDEMKALMARLRTYAPLSPEYFATQKEIDALNTSGKYRLVVKRTDLSFMKYLYNTGRTYWRKEELGIQLSQEEKSEQDLHFINKVMALGYMLTKHKNAGQPYAVFCMETEQSEEGTHLGGTGKSLFASSMEVMRTQLFIDGQGMEQKNDQFMLQGVKPGITDYIFIDDLNRTVDLHKFMPMITGKMVVNPKNTAAFLINFSDSPKVIFTSNHAVKGFDASLRRRTWFCAFSDYYHADDMQKGMKERSPLSEFGKNLISDYDDKEMNSFLNFLMNCMTVWKRIGVRIQPPMKEIEKRIMQRDLTDEFLFWADDYFTEERLNCLVNKDEAFDAYKQTLNPKFAQMMKARTFKQKLILYCSYKEWKFNPQSMLISETEKSRNDIRRKVDGKECYFFYIDTKGTVSDSPSASKLINRESEIPYDQPPF